MTYEWNRVFDALGDSTRRMLMDRLRQGPRPVGELAAGVPVSRPAVSQHLKVLLEAGLVTYRREGTRHIYEPNPECFVKLREYLGRYWGDALERVRKASERR